MLRSLLLLTLVLSLAACDAGSPDAARADLAPGATETADGSRTAQRPGPRTGYPIARRMKVRYGPDATGRQDMEIYIPEGFGPFPVAIVVHGGGFTAGGREATVPTAKMLQSEGIIGVAPSYRLSPAFPAPTDPDRVQHPNHTDDVALAIRWVADHTTQLRADADGIVVMGHSSGSTIATLLAFSPDYLARAGVDRSRIAGLLRLDGHTSDFSDYVPRNDPYDSQAIISTFGDERDRLYPPVVGSDENGDPVYDAPHPLNLSPWYEVADGASLPTAFIASGSAPDRDFHSGRLHQRLLDHGFASQRWPTTLDHGRMLGALRTPETAEEVLYRNAVLGFIRDVTSD